MTRMNALTESWRSQREPWLFWLLAVLVLGVGFGLRDPWPADEPRFALVALQMVESGQWLFPMRGNELYPDKPPMLMWLQAVFLSLTGNVRVAFLLPSLLASLATLWLLRDIGKRLWNAEAGAMAAWALLFALQFTFQARRAQIDPLLVFFVTLSMVGFLRHLLVQPNRVWWCVAWAAAGLGVITKGVGVIALLVLLPAVFAWRGGWTGIHKVRGQDWLLGVLALFAPILAWGVPMLLTVQASNDPALHEYANNILFKQTGQRYAAAWHHHRPFWYFGEVIALQWLPAVLALPWALPRWRDALRARDARVLLPLAWIVLVVLFFSLSKGKREVYILPALPMFCLLLGPWLGQIISQVWPRRVALGFAAVLGLVMLIAGALMVFGQPSFEDKLATSRGLDAATVQSLGAMALGIGLWFAASALWFRKNGVAVLLSTLTGLWLMMGLVATPLINDSSSARALMRDAGISIGADAELGLVAWREQNLLMADRPAATFGFRRSPAEQLADARIWQQHAPQQRWLQMEAVFEPDCFVMDKVIVSGISNRRVWWLVPGDGLRAGCVPTPTADPEVD